MDIDFKRTLLAGFADGGDARTQVVEEGVEECVGRCVRVSREVTLQAKLPKRAASNRERTVALPNHLSPTPSEKP